MHQRQSPQVGLPAPKRARALSLRSKQETEIETPFSADLTTFENSPATKTNPTPIRASFDQHLEPHTPTQSVSACVDPHLVSTAPDDPLRPSMADLTSSPHSQIPLTPSSATFQPRTPHMASAHEFTKRKDWARKVMEDVMDCCQILSTDAHVMFVSPSVTALTDYEPREWLRTSIFQWLYDSDDCENFRRDFADCVEGRSDLKLFTRFRKKDGTCLIFEIWYVISFVALCSVVLSVLVPAHRQDRRSCHLCRFTVTSWGKGGSLSHSRAWLKSTETTGLIVCGHNMKVMFIKVGCSVTFSSSFLSQWSRHSFGNQCGRPSGFLERKTLSDRCLAIIGPVL